MTAPESDAMAYEPLLPEVRDSLADAVRRRAALSQAGQRRRRLRWPARRGTTLLVTAALIGGTAYAATAPWLPQLGDDHRGRPTVATTRVPADQLAALAVLRRPQTAADRGPRMRAMLEQLPGTIVGGVHVDSARLLQSRPDGATALLAIEREGTSKPGGTPLRRSLLCLTIGLDPTTVNGHRMGFQSTQKCETLAGVKAGRLVLGGLLDGRLTLTGVVPDGVARIQVALRTGRVLEARVAGNAYRLDAAAPSGSYEDAAIRWLDRTGRAVPKTP
jgi:hypothetical protein